MAFYSGYPSYSFPATFAAAPVQASASQHEGSQAGDIQQSQSVSGFAQQAQPIDAGFGFPYGAPIATGATFIGGQAPFYGQQIYGQPTVIPGATVLPGATYAAAPTFLPGGALVPVAAPRVRQPGYNERLVAWRNRQKAFNRYKRQTKEAIKNANSAHYQQQNTYLAQSTLLAHPQPTFIGGAAAPIYGQSTIIGGAYPYGAPFGSTFLPAAYPGFLPAGAVYAGEQHEQQGDFNGANEFSSYSQASNAHEVQQEEPEIRGTQV